MRRKVFYVTGSRGFVGIDLCDELLKQGYEVLDDIIIAGRRIDLAEEQLGDFLQAGIDVMVHLAARVPHHSGVNDDAVLKEINKRIDENVASTALKINAKLIYVSSCGLYRRDSCEPLTEKSLVKTRSPYFESKLFGEDISMQNSRTAVLRISAPYGKVLNPTTVLGNFIAKGRIGHGIEIWGTGKREQDFVSTHDITQAVVACMAHNCKGIFNIAAGCPTTMEDLAGFVIDRFGNEKLVSDHIDPLDYERVRIDISKAESILGWSPQTTIENWVRELKLDD